VPLRTKSSFRKHRRETRSESSGILTGESDTSRILEDAGDATSMLAMQELVEKARSCTTQVQKSIIREGLSRNLYSFDPRPMQVDAIWHLLFKKAHLSLPRRLPLERAPSSKPCRYFVVAGSPSRWIKLGNSNVCNRSVDTRDNVPPMHSLQLHWIVPILDL
jgi:hypothetical protein